MTRKELKERLKTGRKAIKWISSGIIEIAWLEGADIYIGNAITEKIYRLPNKYKDINIEILDSGSMVMLGDLIPKSLR